MVRKEIDLGGNIHYYNTQNQFHREDGPAIEYINGDKAWYMYDKLHRVDGSAVEYVDGDKDYYIMGREYSYEAWLAIKDYPLLW